MADGARLPTTLVVISAGAMVTVGVIAAVSAPAPEEAPLEASPVATIEVRDSTPAIAAETFYDAWRRRQWGVAAAVSEGIAARRVARKAASDADLSPENRTLAERGWQALAAAPLTLRLDESETLDDGVLRLSGTAEYDFVGQPYRRRVAFEVQGEGDRWRVREMELGEVLTELPELFREADQP